MRKPGKASSSGLPLLLVSDGRGDVFEVPELRMAGMSLNECRLPAPEDLVEMPVGSNLYVLPCRVPVGYDPSSKRFVDLPEYGGRKVFAVAAFMAPAYLQILRSAYRTADGAPRLPLYSYTAVGWKNGKFVCAGMRIDRDVRQDLALVDIKKVEREAAVMLKKYPKNRLVRHLVGNCVLRYGCPAARNFSLGRFECPLPVSRACNSSCLGCLSKQPATAGFPAPHERICFTPEPWEVAEVAVQHLERADQPVVSFGQGCEGEPLTEGDLLEESIRLIRKRTDRGIVNLNTNASRPDVLERLCRAGLDSVRVSLSSARKKYYDLYYRPGGYSFDDVVESMRICRGYGRWTSANYLMFPGFTDDPEEMKALDGLVSKTGLSMIQTRNLNIDPERYIAAMGLPDRSGASVGIRSWVDHVRKRHPRLKLGYFNPSQKTMRPG